MSNVPVADAGLTGLTGLGGGKAKSTRCAAQGEIWFYRHSARPLSCASARSPNRGFRARPLWTDPYRIARQNGTPVQTSRTL